MVAPRRTSITDDILWQGFALSRQLMDVTARTLDDYRVRMGLFRRFLGERFPGITLVQAERQHIESYLVSMREQGRSPHTVRTTYRALHAFYRWALDEDLIAVSPLQKIKAPRVPKLQKPFLAESDFRKLLSVCIPHTFLGDRNAAMLWILWTSGVRSEELSQLQVRDLDVQGERIHVFGKGRKERAVEYAPDARRAVWQYMKHRVDDIPALWLTEERTPMQVRGVRMAIHRTYERAGVVAQDRMHIMRRTWAVRKLREGLPERYVMVLGGWEDIATMDRYVAAIGVDEALEAAKAKRHK